MTQHVSWPEIENFHNLRRSLEKYPNLLGDDKKVTYRAKVKVHGTNAGVRIDPDGTVTALSRSAVITPRADNLGFAKWVSEHEQSFSRLARNFTIVVFGEWCGPGIQKGVAVCGIPKKSFAVFGARIPEINGIATDPTYLSALVEGLQDTRVLPWYEGGKTYTVDWLTSGDALQATLDVINDDVHAVEREDPWVSRTWGVKGVGEGLVFYPQGRGDSYKIFGDLVFKAKGEKHNTVAKTRPAQKEATTVEGLADFVDLVVTEARLEQGSSHVMLHGSGVPFDVRDMGEFLRWIHADLVKETAAELAASKLEPKEAYKACTNQARAWYMNQSRKLQG